MYSFPNDPRTVGTGGGISPSTQFLAETNPISTGGTEYAPLGFLYLPSALDPSGRSENAKVTIHAAKLHRFSHRVKARKTGFKTFLKSYLDF